MSRKITMAIAGMHIESGTFSPLRSRVGDFLALRGDEMLSRYPFLTHKEFAEIEARPLVHFRAMPGGMIVREDYEAMKQEILDRLQALERMPDAFYFDVHGAMTVEGIVDAEADLLDSIRAVLPANVIISCSQDLHGNVSPKLVAMVEVMTTYRTAPHIDWMETRERALRLLLRCFHEQTTPYRAYVPIPVLVSGEMSSTEYQPGSSLYAPLAEESQILGVWDASLWVGYAWADQQRAMATVVVTGCDSTAVTQVAGQIAQRYWDARHEFSFITEAGPVEWCVEQALASEEKPAFCSDAGDNPTAGGAGDVTATLHYLLEHDDFSSAKRSAIFASIPDHAALATMIAAGVGQQVEVELGGKLDPVHGSPLTINASVYSLIKGDDAQGVLQCGGVKVIVSGRRRPYHLRNDFLALGLDPLLTDLTVVKIGYLEPELKAMARRHWLILSPGGVRADYWNLNYQQLTRPIFPLDKNFTWIPQVQLFGGQPSFFR
jgi:microcystin degradation protein MlrC